MFLILLNMIKITAAICDTTIQVILTSDSQLQFWYESSISANVQLSLVRQCTILKRSAWSSFCGFQSEYI